MIAVTVKNVGGPEVLSLEETPTPVPKAEQLLVRVKATALNRADLLQRKGKYPPPPGESDILGLEIAGEVVSLGERASHFKVGDRVFGLVGSGAYAEYCLIDHEMAMPIPDSLSYVEAAAVPEAFLTAQEAIFSLGELQPKETILIHAGASGVGTAGIQLAHHMGARVMTTVGSTEKKAFVLGLGAEEVINYKQDDFALILKDQSIQVIVDFIGANYLAKNLQILAPQGRLICVGLMGGAKAEINLDTILMKRLQIKGLRMRGQSLQEKRVLTRQFAKKWLPALAERKIHPVIDSVFPFAEVQKAHQRMEENLNCGKIVLEI